MKLTVGILRPYCQATINDNEENHRRKINGQERKPALDSFPK